jgi:hypothetical protein
MSKKSLIFGSIVLLLAMVFALTGCDNPAGPKGDPGDPGNGLKGDQGLVGGGGLSGGVVRAVDLEEAFALSDLVIVQSNVIRISGVVPAGKTLKILGEGVLVEDPGTAGIQDLELEAGATLIINEGADLSARALPGAEGKLIAASGAKVEGKGAIVLPVDLSPNQSYTASLHWESSAISGDTQKYPGSWYPNSLLDPIPDGHPWAVAQINSDAIQAIFIDKEYNELTVKDIAGLENHAIPPYKTLTLVGENTITPPFLLENYAKLIVGESGILDISGGAANAAFSSNSAAEFVNEGRVNLDINARLIGNSGGLTNNGTIYTKSITATNIVELLGITATEYTKTATIVVENGNPGGSIWLTSTGTALGAPIPLNQNLVLAPEVATSYNLAEIAAATRPFTGFGLGGKPLITIKAGATLVLAAVSETIGTTVNNEGLITTATASFTTLQNIFTDTGGIGSVSSVAAAAIILEKDESFVIPKGTTLTLNNTVATTFASGPNIIPASKDSPLTVSGRLINAANNALAPKGDITVTGHIHLGTTNSGSLTIAAGKTLDISSTATFEGEGVLKQEDQTTSIVKINGEGGINGYKFSSDTTGLTAADVAGKNFEKALADIKSVRSSFTDNFDLNDIAASASFGAYSGQKVIGTVDLVGVTASTLAPIRFSTVANEGYIVIPDGVSISATAYAIVPNAQSVRPFNAANEFAMDIMPNRQLGLSNNPPAGGTDRFGVLEFNKLIILKSNLRSPELHDLYHVGVKSQRSY